MRTLEQIMVRWRGGAGKRPARAEMPLPKAAALGAETIRRHAGRADHAGQDAAAARHRVERARAFLQAPAEPRSRQRQSPDLVDARTGLPPRRGRREGFRHYAQVIDPESVMGESMPVAPAVRGQQHGGDRGMETVAETLGRIEQLLYEARSTGLFAFSGQ